MSLSKEIKDCETCNVDIGKLCATHLKELQELFSELDLGSLMSKNKLIDENKHDYLKEEKE